MYKLISSISIFLRQFILPNPFEALPAPLTLSLSGAKILLTPTILNLLAEPFLHSVTFIIVGLYYHRHIDSPSTGSFLYLIFYCVHVALLMLIAKFSFSTLIVIFVIIGYLFCHIGLFRFVNHSSLL